MDASQGPPCVICQNPIYYNMDGLMYCSQCGSMSQHDIQREDDDGVMSGLGFTKLKTTTIKKYTAPGERANLDALYTRLDGLDPLSTSTAQNLPRTRLIDRIKRQERTLSESEQFTENYLLERDEPKSTKKTVPVPLRPFGVRVASFTAILARCSTAMIAELGFPSELSEQCLALWQNYLKYCSVAFCENEISDDISLCYHTLVNKAASIRNMDKRKLRHLKKQKSERMLKANKDGQFWNLLTSRHVNEKLQVDVDQVKEVKGTKTTKRKYKNGSDDDEGIIREEEQESQEDEEDNWEELEIDEFVVNTSIYFGAIRNCVNMYLSVELAVAVLYTATHQLGCHWVTLSDLVRWIREDRLPIEHTLVGWLEVYLGANKSDSHVKNTIGPIRKRKLRGSLQSIYPLSEYYRVLSMLWQSINVPSRPMKAHFDELVARLAYSLNLPSDLMSRINALIHLAPVEKWMDEHSLRRQGDVRHGFNLKNLMDISILTGEKLQSECFPFCFGRFTSLKFPCTTDIFLAQETKGMALIIVALKLMYGLDDSREYKIQADVSVENRKCLSFREWMWQSKMRSAIWKGARACDVIKKGAMMFDNPDLPRLFIDKKNSLQIRLDRNHKQFSHCVPKVKVQERMFESDVCNPNDSRSKSNGDDAVYAPLRDMSRISSDELAIYPDQNESIFDSDAKRVLLGNFKDFSLNYESLDISCKKKYGSYEKSEERCENNERRSTWRNLFPCSKHYVVYPRPKFCDYSLYQIRDKFSSQVALDDKDAHSLHTCASRSFSDSFSHLLSLCSLLIAEQPSTLYAAVVLLEMMTVDRQRTLEIFTRLSKGKSVPLKLARRVPYVDKSKEDLLEDTRFSCVDPPSTMSDVCLIEVENEYMRKKPKHRSTELKKAHLASDFEQLDLNDADDEERSMPTEVACSDVKEPPLKKSCLPEDVLPTLPDFDDKDEQGEKDLLPKCTYEPPPREPLNVGEVVKTHSTDFDTIWRLIAMRYW